MGIANAELGVVSNVDKIIKREKLKEKRNADKMKINEKTILKVLREIVKPDNYKINLIPYSPDSIHAEKLNVFTHDESFNMRSFYACLSYNGDHTSKNIYKTLEKEMDKIDRSVWNMKNLEVVITLKTKYFNVFFKCYHPDKYDTKNSEKEEGFYQFMIEINPKSDMLLKTSGLKYDTTTKKWTNDTNPNNTGKVYKFHFTLNKLIWNCGGFEFPSINNLGKEPISYTNKDVNEEFNKFAELFKE